MKKEQYYKASDILTEIADCEEVLEEISNTGTTKLYYVTRTIEILYNRKSKIHGKLLESLAEQIKEYYTNKLKELNKELEQL